MTAIDAPYNFVPLADRQIRRAHLEEQLGDPRQRRRSPRIHRRLERIPPRQQEEIAVVRVVIRVVMGDEDVAERAEDTGRHHLPRDAVAAIDHIPAIADHDDLRRARSARLRCRSARGAEQDKSGAGDGLAECLPRRNPRSFDSAKAGRSGQRHKAAKMDQKIPAVHAVHSIRPSPGFQNSVRTSGLSTFPIALRGSPVT